jgi:hypothetical protein
VGNVRLRELGGFCAIACSWLGLSAKSALKFVFYIMPFQIAGGEKNQAVVDHIGHFVDDPVIAFAGCGDNDLHCFFADLLEDFAFAFLKQLGGVGTGRWIGFAALDGIE